MASDNEEKQTTGNSGDGDKPKKTSPLEQAKSENERMEKNIKEIKEQRGELAKEQADAVIAGNASAGQSSQPKETDQEKYEKGVADRYEGTGENPLPDKKE